MRVLVTGANGFVGRALVDRLEYAKDLEVSAAVRALNACNQGDNRFHSIGEVSAHTDWRAALEGVEVVVHLAARAHVLNDDQSQAEALFRSVNVAGALALAAQAATAGVKRFIFVSSIGVNGNKSVEPFTEESAVQPHALYAQSKYEAELALAALAQREGMELVIVRPPLVYDADAPGNFKRLLGLVRRGLPLPLGSINNKRSMISRRNLIEILYLCITHPAAANELFLVADGEDFSTAEIVRHLALGMKSRSWLIPVPKRLLEKAASLAGRSGLYTQLCESLQVDASKVTRLLGWSADVAARDQLKAVGETYVSSRRTSY